MRTFSSLLLVTAVVGSAQAAAPASLIAVSGQVFVTPPGGSEGPAAQGSELAAGTRVRTAAQATAEVRFDDGSTVKLQSNTAMAISGNKRAQAKKNSVLLFFGRVWSKIARSTGGTNFEIATPNAVCGVRGTEFETGVADDGSLRVRVSEGKVAVDDEGDAEPAEEVDPGEEVAADEDGVDDAGRAEEQAKWEQWQKDKQKRLEKGARPILDKVKGKIMSRKQKLEALRARQKDVEGKRKAAEDRLRAGERKAIEEVRGFNQELATIADEIADLGDEADSQFGYVDHLADLAKDPRFKLIDRKYLEAEAASLRRVKATLDAMVKEGTDLSLESMNKLLDDMSKSKGTLKDKGGSAADDLFGGDEQMR